MSAPLTSDERQALLAKRDLSVDLVRVTCVLLVVVLHSLMLGLEVRPDGGVGWRNIVQDQPWFPVASFVQTSVDLLGALSFPAGHGHQYGTEQGTRAPLCERSGQIAPRAAS